MVGEQQHFKNLLNRIKNLSIYINTPSNVLKEWPQRGGAVSEEIREVSFITTTGGSWNLGEYRILEDKKGGTQ